MAERISFLPGAMPYSAMLAAEHIARYTIARPLAAGKRVLDVACGEGYGAALLREGDATGVVGVDISADAIAIARERFARDGITFHVGDALDPAVLAPLGPFDLITCFETIEHVSDARRLLDNLRDVLAENGTILISCPNDALDTARGIENPFHASTYSFADFKALTMAALGEASQWFLGTPLTGLGIVAEGDARLITRDASMALSLQGAAAPQSSLLPAQQEHGVSPETATFFMGIWNGTVDTTQVTAPLSRASFIEPWLEIDRLRLANAEQAIALAHFRELARVSEERVREIRRIAAIEKDTLIAEVTALRYFHDVAFQSRAHRLAAAYIRNATGNTPISRLLRGLRALGGKVIRALRGITR